MSHQIKYRRASGIGRAVEYDTLPYGHRNVYHIHMHIIGKVFNVPTYDISSIESKGETEIRSAFNVS